MSRVAQSKYCFPIFREKKWVGEFVKYQGISLVIAPWLKQNKLIWLLATAASSAGRNVRPIKRTCASVISYRPAAPILFSQLFLPPTLTWEGGERLTLSFVSLCAAGLWRHLKINATKKTLFFLHSSARHLTGTSLRVVYTMRLAMRVEGSCVAFVQSAMHI